MSFLSNNGHFTVLMQDDGNAVIYNDGVPIWDSASNKSYSVPVPIKPTPGVLRNIKASFCSTYDENNLIIFDPIYLASTPNLALTLSDKVNMGLTHAVIQVPNGKSYPGYTLPWPYPDLRSNLSAFTDYVGKVLDNISFAIIFLTSGDEGTNNYIYDGTLAARCNAVLPYKDKIIALPGWEVFGANPSWTSRQVSDAWLLIRSILGDSTLIGAHNNSSDPERFTWASYPIQADDPSGGDEIGAWYTAGGNEVDLLLAQTPLDAPLNDNWKSRWLEGVNRFLDPSTIPAWVRAIEPTAPDWFARTRTRGRVTLAAFEPGVPYQFIRHNIDRSSVQTMNSYITSTGVMGQGCL